ncbi:unnamed protein product [Amoebophrya sp. A25]|nr:unnamed protein product [Amoebophrya sp. A25]|eukprot:GSA25T00025200001.1
MSQHHPLLLVSRQVQQSATSSTDRLLASLAKWRHRRQGSSISRAASTSPGSPRSSISTKEQQPRGPVSWCLQRRRSRLVAFLASVPDLRKEHSTHPSMKIIYVFM